MSTVEPFPAHLVGVGDIAAEVLAITPAIGPNETEWPGLTAYRLTRPQAPQWAEAHSLALCCVVQGRKRFIVDDRDYVCDPHHYLLLTRGMRFETEILEASVDAPCLSFVLQIEQATGVDDHLDRARGPGPLTSRRPGPVRQALDRTATHSVLATKEGAMARQSWRHA